MPIRERELASADPQAGTWSPPQLLALAVGAGYAVLGGVAVLRTGVPELFEPVTQVAGLAYTPLLGIAELAFGFLLLTAGAFQTARRHVVFLGMLALVFGLLVVIEPAVLEEWVGVDWAHGWFYALTGGMVALVGLATPTVSGRPLSVLRRRITGARGSSDRSGAGPYDTPPDPAVSARGTGEDDEQRSAVGQPTAGRTDTQPIHPEPPSPGRGR